VVLVNTVVVLDPDGLVASLLPARVVVADLLLTVVLEFVVSDLARLELLVESLLERLGVRARLDDRALTGGNLGLSCFRGLDRVAFVEDGFAADLSLRSRGDLAAVER